MSAGLTVKSNLYDAIKRNTDNSEDVIFARHKYSPSSLPVGKPHHVRFQSQWPASTLCKMPAFLWEPIGFAINQSAQRSREP